MSGGIRKGRVSLRYGMEPSHAVHASHLKGRASVPRKRRGFNHQTKKKEALCRSRDGIHGLRFMPKVTAYQNDSNSRKTVKSGQAAAWRVSRSGSVASGLSGGNSIGEIAEYLPEIRLSGNAGR